jgi:hypothetical protein
MARARPRIFACVPSQCRCCQSVLLQGDQASGIGSTDHYLGRLRGFAPRRARDDGRWPATSGHCGPLIEVSEQPDRTGSPLRETYSCFASNVLRWRWSPSPASNCSAACPKASSTSAEYASKIEVRPLSGTRCWQRMERTSSKPTSLRVQIAPEPVNPPTQFTDLDLLRAEGCATGFVATFGVGSRAIFEKAQGPLRRRLEIGRR